MQWTPLPAGVGGLSVSSCRQHSPQCCAATQSLLMPEHMCALQSSRSRSVDQTCTLHSEDRTIACRAGKWPNLYSQTTYNIEKAIRFFYLATSELNWRPSSDEVRGLGASLHPRVGRAAGARVAVSATRACSPCAPAHVPNVWGKHPQQAVGSGQSCGMVTGRVRNNCVDPCLFGRQDILGTGKSS